MLCIIGTAYAQDASEIGYSAAPAWVVDVAIPETSSAATEGLAASVRLASYQFYLGKEGGGTLYTRQVLLAQDASALQRLGTLTVSYIKGRTQLTVHHVHIIRDGKIIDVLASGQKFQVYRKEGAVTEGLVRGQIIGFLQLNDLRVGDLIDTATSVVQTADLLTPNYENRISYANGIQADRIFHRITWDKSRKVYWRSGTKLPKMEPGTQGDFQFVQASADNQVEKAFDNSVPARFANDYTLDLTTFAGWPDVTSVFAPAFEAASSPQPGADLAARIADIAARNDGALQRATEALHIVQSEVRYTGNLEGLGNYKPVDANEVWNNRFGDCKGKTALLTMMLRSLGITATPALVSVTGSTLVATSLAQPLVFDHAIVKAVIDGKTYWLDGTRSNDRDLTQIDPPFFLQALPLVAGGSLEQLPTPQYVRPTQIFDFRVDASAGFDKPAPIMMTFTFQGEAAAAFSAATKSTTAAQRAESIKQFQETSKDKDFVFESMDTFDRPETGTSGYILKGTAKLQWNDDGEFNETLIDTLNVGTDFVTERDRLDTKDLPVESEPQFTESNIHVILPKQVSEYTLVGHPVEKQIGPAHYVREVKIANGEFVGRTSTDVAYKEMTMAEAKKYEVASDKIFEDKIYIHAEHAGAAIKTGDRNIADQAGALAAGGDVTGANTLLTAELKTRPKSPELLFAHATLLHENGLPNAERDLQRLLLQEPGHEGALQLLATISAEQGDFELADSYVDKLKSSAPKNKWAQRWTITRKKMEDEQALKDTSPVESKTEPEN